MYITNIILGDEMGQSNIYSDFYVALHLHTEYWADT